MRGRIVKIDPLKESRNKNQAYHRVYFQVQDYEKTDNGSIKLVSKWYKTDLVSSFRNYKRWQPYLKVGAVFTNLKAKDKATIDADSQFAYETNVEVKDTEIIKEHIKQLELL